jgi:integrase
MHLTDHTVKRLRVDAGRAVYSDDSVPGFGLRVSSNGAKSFVLLVGRNRKRITIGRYPIVTLHEARARAREIIAERTLGKDDLPSLKFEAAVPIFLASRYGDNYLKPRTPNEVERLLRRHFLPKFRHDQLSEIKAHQIADLIDGLRRTPSIAHHAFGAIRLFFRWAETRQYVHRSPCAVLQPPRSSRPRERVLSLDEIKALLSEARQSGTTFAIIVELLLLTGQRRGEIASIRAEWIDWEQRTITFPYTVTKNKRTHTIPFCGRVNTLLRKGNGKGLLFPARGTDDARPFDGWSKCKPKFDLECPMPHWVLHDLRRTFASGLASIGIQMPVTERLLNHVSGSFSGIVGVYQRYDFVPEMRNAVVAWEEYIQKLGG